MTEQQKFEAWADAKFGRAPGAILQHERYASLFEVWQARASQDRSVELLEALEAMLAMHEEGATLVGLVGPTVANARAAISKARGE